MLGSHGVVGHRSAEAASKFVAPGTGQKRLGGWAAMLAMAVLAVVAVLALAMAVLAVVVVLALTLRRTNCADLSRLEEA